jgi:hypothetical protein
VTAVAAQGDEALAVAVRAATVAELCWRRPDGLPGAAPVVPLVLAGAPVVAVPYAHEAWARTVAASPTAGLVLSDPRMTGSAWRSLAVVGTPTLVEDEEGEVFCAQLLEEELRKHPPSRAYADSALLRREHWWYLPRLLLRLEDGVPREVGARDGDRDAVLTVATADGGLHVDTVRVEDWDADPVDVRSLGSPGSTAVRRDPPDGPAVLLGHEFSVPDLERWSPHVTTGTLAGGRLAVDARPEGRGLERVPGLLARVRRHRALEKACVAALRGR